MQGQNFIITLYTTIALFPSLNTVAAIRIQPHIIGGNEVDIAKHPYVVSIRYRLAVNGPYWHKCAGAIISERAVLTAAQCVRDVVEGDRVMIVAGANWRKGADGIQYIASKWIVHANFSTYTADYDIGIFFVDSPFELDGKRASLRSISIRTHPPAVGSLATVAGWGYREEFGPSSNNLEEIKVPIVSKTQCLSIYGKGKVTERMICAGYVSRGGRDVCQGDTGGPLVYNGALVGLVSWGRGCARAGYPSVYTYAESLRSWINDQLE